MAVSYQGPVGYITLNNQKELNAISLQTVKDICDSLVSMHYDDRVKVIVFNSSIPGIFCAGADIKWLSSGFDYEYGLRNEPLHNVLEAFNKNRKPVIAALNGKALGGGF